MRRVPGLLAVSVLTLTACGPAGGRSSEPLADRGSVETTHRALVAAVAEDLDRAPKVAAPLLAEDLDEDDPPTRPLLAVEVAFDEEVGDNSHVRLSIDRLPRAATFTCENRRLRGVSGCRDLPAAAGGPVVLWWEAAYPEEDPGTIIATQRRDDVVLRASYDGQEVPERLAGTDLADLADGLVALVSDPRVAFETTPELVAVGEDLPDAVMLDWYGQGNGAPPPPGYSEAADGEQG